MKSRHFRMNGKWVTAAEFGEQISDLIEKGWTLTPPHPTDTETLAEVLAAHVRLTAMDFPFACSCDPYTQDGTRSYTAHLTEALARIVQARAGEGALREALTFLDGLVRGYEAHASIPTILRSRVLQDLTDLRAALTPADPS